ncbi:MAG: Protein kinase [Alyxoria varia]|nr:MAG: Protein kinase [Alyxoria varia]
MASTVNDEDLALSINPAYSRRGSNTNNHRGFAGDNGDATSSQQQKQAHRHHNQPTRSHAPAIQPGPKQRLGQYQILETLGEGSFGKVKLAVHQVTKQKVALKIISRRKLMARDMAGRIEREIQYLQLLRHPHIIKLFTVITTPAEIIMVLEYAGSELFQYIVEHGKMVEDKARTFFQQIVCAVEYCHRHKIVHRDLKPENLLLDDKFHVKIADFGLSNIMTDGNFLKTSCGSPNYAAPEVISGKLYAGPEVDVWSCGVILYVLLVGRLPFDDEYIPSLFKKIAQGSYSIPSYLSPGSVRLIKKMLQISPVHRITIQEIRQDPWFTENLAEYLQPQVEEFFDTGIDPNKAIDPRQLAKNKPPALQDKIHDSVVGKLGKTMGYGRDDVQQALAIDEPNAIKDAYLIVRENQIMKETPSIAKDPSFQPFLEQSPPTYATSPISAVTEDPNLSISELMQSVSSRGEQYHPERSRHGSAGGQGIGESRSPVNTIGVLPSSLPDYHEAFMKGQPTPGTSEYSHDHDVHAVDAPPKQSAEKQAATAMHLKPQTRSQLNLEKMGRPDSMTPVAQPQRRTKQTKWQFGIRSRNQPAEAMLAIYKALRAMGAEWEIPKSREPGSHLASGVEDPGSVSASDESSDSDQAPKEDRQKHGSYGSGSSGSTRRGRRNGRYIRHSSSNDWGYEVPTDPWIINARIRKDGLYPPGVYHPNSAHSSRIDLRSPDHANREGQVYGAGLQSGQSSARGSETALAGQQPQGQSRSRRSSTLSSAGSTTALTSANTVTSQPQQGDPSIGQQAQQPPTTTQLSNQAQLSAVSSSASVASNSRPGSRRNLAHRTYPQPMTSSSTTSSAVGGAQPQADDVAYVYMTIQLYSIEKEFYLVDFKCAGYERLVMKGVKQAMHDAFGGGLHSDDHISPRPDETSSGSTSTARPLEQNISVHSREARSNSPHHHQPALQPLHPAEPQHYQQQQHSEQDKEHMQLVGDGRAVEEKDVSSPFPFLDVASRLIIQLAEAE